MPKYAIGTPDGHRVTPTDDEMVLIRGASHPRSNIAAFHFDGLWLIECLRLAREIEAVHIRNISPYVF